MVDTMNAYQKEGMKVREAAAFGVRDRLRPILNYQHYNYCWFNSASTERSFLDAFESSAIIFGLIAATLIALVVIPCLYLQFTPKTEMNESELIWYRK